VLVSALGFFMQLSWVAAAGLVLCVLLMLLAQTSLAGPWLNVVVRPLVLAACFVDIAVLARRAAKVLPPGLPRTIAKDRRLLAVLAQVLFSLGGCVYSLFARRQEVPNVLAWVVCVLLIQSMGLIAGLVSRTTRG
jgi:hypothetical protein